jgi:hypothetical protein
MDNLIPDIDTDIERAVTQLLMDCAELTALEALLSRFNIFRVLRAAKHEIRHSNMLAWGPNSRVVLCEISFWTKNAELQITVGDAKQ